MPSGVRVNARGYFLRILVENIGSDECFIWPFSKTKRHLGYGKMFWDTSSRSVLVHRKAYEQTYGEIPDGFSALHNCDHSLCFNPRHLYLGTQLDNVRDAVERGRLGTIGEKNSKAKLTEENVQQIRQRFIQGESKEALQIEYGVKNLSDLLRLKAWKHVPKTDGYDQANRPLPVAFCLWCRNEFSQRVPFQKYCSRKCFGRHYESLRGPRIIRPVAVGVSLDAAIHDTQNT